MDYYSLNNSLSPRRSLMRFSVLSLCNLYRNF